jgi:Ran GTPase-activating protein (RanGAP) involved in mRNA processing and transport
MVRIPLVFQLIDIIERTGLKAIDLGFNFSTGTASKMLKLMNTLAEVIKRHPTLEYLGLGGNGDKQAIGKEIEPLFKALSANPKLVELDISGNKFGDQIAVLLCDQLRSNTHLRSISFDNNLVAIGGWRAFLTLFGTNKNFVNAPLPLVDVDR